MFDYLNLKPETLELICWLDSKKYVSDYDSENTGELIELLRNDLLESFSNIPLNFIEILRERVEWDKIKDYLKVRKEIDAARKRQESFMQWVNQNYEHSGEQYYLSKNPDSFLMYELYTLEEQYNREHPLPLIEGKEYHLIVENNKTYERLYHRELTGENVLKIEEYLPEIEQATGLKFKHIPFGTIFAGSGQIGITIAFNKDNDDEEEDSVWDYEDYSLV